jgi:hypothetical protein
MLGNAPARSFISFERQVFTIVNSQTAYTLSHSVTNENDIRLVINNIVQEPGSGKAYTASGTTLTLSAALTNGTDEMYCVFLGRATATNAPAAGSVNTAAIAADAITEAKIADDAVENEHLNVNVITGQTAETSIATDDTILIHDTSASALRKMTRANFVSGIGGNAPAFRVKLSGNQSMSAGAHTKIQFDTEDFDTDNAYDNSSNYRFTPQVAGKYFIYLGVFYDHSSGTPTLYNSQIYKNGSSFEGTYHGTLSGSIGHYASSITVNTIVTLNGSSDYVEAYGRQSGTGSPVMTTASFFGGFLLGGV